MIVDDEGRPVATPDRVRRVVSIVPSLTEAVALSDRALLVGATDWCTHPADLDVTRVRGTKNPDVAAIVELAPDLVVANQEENRPADLDALRAAGVAGVRHRHPHPRRRCRGARCARACSRPAGSPVRVGSTDAERAWAAVPEPRGARRAVVPIWRRPWMAVGRDTFTGAVLARLGVDNALCNDLERYPRFDPEALPAHDLVVLPDEPYNFTAEDGPESFPGTQSVLVSGRLLTWYGPSLAEAARVLPALLQED